jgi:hypothetical protein
MIMMMMTMMMMMMMNKRIISLKYLSILSRTNKDAKIFFILVNTPKLSRVVLTGVNVMI